MEFLKSAIENRLTSEQWHSLKWKSEFNLTPQTKSNLLRNIHDESMNVSSHISSNLFLKSNIIHSKAVKLRCSWKKIKEEKRKTASQLHQQLQLWWSWKKKNIGSLMNLQLHLWWGLKKNKTWLLMQLQLTCRWRKKKKTGWFLVHHQLIQRWSWKRTIHATAPSAEVQQNPQVNWTYYRDSNDVKYYSHEGQLIQYRRSARNHLSNVIARPLDKLLLMAD